MYFLGWLRILTFCVCIYTKVMMMIISVQNQLNSCWLYVSTTYILLFLDHIPISIWLA